MRSPVPSRFEQANESLSRVPTTEDRCGIAWAPAHMKHPWSRHAIRAAPGHTAAPSPPATAMPIPRYTRSPKMKVESSNRPAPTASPPIVITPQSQPNSITPASERKILPPPQSPPSKRRAAPGSAVRLRPHNPTARAVWKSRSTLVPTAVCARPKTATPRWLRRATLQSLIREMLRFSGNPARRFDPQNCDPQAASRVVPRQHSRPSPTTHRLRRAIAVARAKCT